MYISKIRVKDYKSFRDSGDIEFKSGINIIVGQNNAGKTSLLEALEIKIVDIPHRSVKTPKNKVYSNKDKNNSAIYISLTLDKENMSELDSYLEKVSLGGYDHTILRVPFPKSYKKSIQSLGSHISSDKEVLESRSDKEKRIEEYNLEKDNSKRKLKEFIEKINIAFKDVLTLNFKYSDHNPLFESLNYGLLNEDFDTKSETIILNLNKITLEFECRPDDDRLQQFRGNNSKEVTVFGWEEMKKFKDKIYRFSAERPNLGSCVVGFSKELLPDASNLAEVLQNIKNDNPDIYEEFNRYITEVIPSVKWVSSNKIETPQSGIGGNWNEVRVWSVDKKTRRTDLAFPLSASGTGAGQVLAILFVAIASAEEPRTIIIDEPNSFLHPSATQKLIQILNKFPQHQYFISTHSPEVVTASNPSTITMLNYIDGETKVEQIDLSNAKGIKKVFVDLGIEPSTFAFTNHILWVEGPTEVKAFSKILEDAKINNVLIKPTVPSEFRQNKKRFENVRHIFNLHEEISGTNSVISPKMTILLDKEIGKEKENTDLIREFGKDKFNFIPRAMYENYLLDPDAITYILKFTKQTDDFKENYSNDEIVNKKLNVKSVINFIEETRSNRTFLPDKLKSKENLTEKEWLENVDGAKLLDKLLKGFLGKPFGYAPHKVEYGEKLTQWLLENKPEQLSELKDFLVDLVKS